ncbi:Fic family protein [Candidatus Saccharibacteria bacterium]|nr:Fic family protein [Candidatus Saccharibacteria bacterium]MBQ7040656.1 Fic family protein [Candidatus Saccharibacteria bacterium]
MKRYNQGNFIREQADTDFEYQYFMPSLLPDIFEFDDPNINVLLEDATQKLGELNAYSLLTPDIDFFIKMHEVKEATESSRIEGTRTNVDEAVMDEEDVEPEKRDDWREVQNYVKALNFAIDKMQTLPLATRLIKETHAVLLSGVRGENKTPGEIRKSQNWIGGETIKDARFVPPLYTEIDRYLSDLDHYLNDKALSTPILIKAAIAHYQFETVHPFLDGNGRMGRLLIVLYLINKDKLSRPVLYLSDYFSKHRQGYYSALDAVRYDGDLEHWVKFFLVAVANTAKASCETLQKIIELREKTSAKIITNGKMVQNSTKIIDSMYSRPVMSVNEMANKMEVSYQAASKIAKELMSLGILGEIAGAQRGRNYAFKEYLELFM